MSLMWMIYVETGTHGPSAVWLSNDLHAPWGYTVHGGLLMDMTHLDTSPGENIITFSLAPFPYGNPGHMSWTLTVRETIWTDVLHTASGGYSCGGPEGPPCGTITELVRFNGTTNAIYNVPGPDLGGTAALLAALLLFTLARLRRATT